MAVNWSCSRDHFVMAQQFRPAWWGFGVFTCTILVVLAVLPPFVGPGLRHALMQGFDLTCHQIPERSFQIGGIPFALCHRCMGVVVGLVIGSMLVATFREADSSFFPHARSILILSVFPMVVDWGLDALGIWANVPFSRVITGLVFGVVAGYTFARALSVFHSEPSQVPELAPERSLSHSSPSVHA